ncbi:hypothetical protein [Xanthomonas medicagonis]|uniref:hypothetical protein n=1 Tax=Xanthomonas medicagonis TaxID=3160841 RepID=UPI003519CAAD
MGAVFLVGCFIRVDSPAFISRAAGDRAKIAKLHSLQEAWDRLGKARQFFVCCTAYLIMAAGLLLLWHDPRLARYFWMVPALYAIDLAVILQIKRYASSVLDRQSIGHTEVLEVINQHINMSVALSIIFVVLALRK